MKPKFLFLFFVVTIQSMCNAQTLNWGAYFYTNNNFSASDVAIDADGNTYTVGLFVSGGDFDPGPGVFNINELSSTVGNYFCVKLNPNGNFVWAMPVGGTNNVNTVIGGYGPKISIDNNSGFIYITGAYSSQVDFDPSAASFFIPPPNSGGPEYNFLAKYTLNGNLVWAKYIAEIGTVISEIAADSSGGINLIGVFSGTLDLDPGPNVFNVSTSPSGDDFYILKYNLNGEFQWAKQFGDPTRLDEVYDITIDNQNNIIITGLFSGLVDFDPNSGVTNLQSNNNSNDAFIAKYTNNGELIWTKSFGSTNTGIERGNAITVDNQNNIYATGSFSGLTDFDPSANTVNLSPVGTRSIYILKLNSNGDFDFVKTIGAPGTEVVYDIAVDNDGSLYLTGYYLSSMDCDPDSGVFTVTANGGNPEIFLVSLSASNGQFGWAKSIGGTGNDEGKRMAIHHPSNRLTLVGHFQNGSSVDFDPPNGYYLPYAQASGSASYVINYSYTSLSNPEFSPENSIVITPNPANEVINIQSNQPIENYQLIDLTGKIITSESNSNTINVSTINPGIYLLKINSNNTTTTKKVVIE
ncbi:MAG: SBBP repeat-containing protein [Flavobacteriales bacterium]|nr:SBBP repeat-containing protein [Flavobacteriales bacterium]